MLFISVGLARQMLQTCCDRMSWMALWTLPSIMVNAISWRTEMVTSLVSWTTDGVSDSAPYWSWT